MLTLITGLPGSGKTTLAKAWATHAGALHLNSDVLRREMDLMGHYRPEDKKKVYAALQERTRAALLEGRNVVVDSTFYRESLREPFRRLAAECNAALYWVEIRAQERTIHERLQKPRPDSEADFGVYEKIRDEYEPIPEQHLVLWSDQSSLDEMTSAIQAYVNQSG